MPEHKSLINSWALEPPNPRNSRVESVVAVVGLGHLKGILALWDQEWLEIEPPHRRPRKVAFDAAYVSSISQAPPSAYKAKKAFLYGGALGLTTGGLLGYCISTKISWYLSSLLASNAPKAIAKVITMLKGVQGKALALGGAFVCSLSSAFLVGSSSIFLVEQTIPSASVPEVDDQEKLPVLNLKAQHAGVVLGGSIAALGLGRLGNLGALGIGEGVLGAKGITILGGGLAIAGGLVGFDFGGTAVQRTMWMAGLN